MKADQLKMIVAYYGMSIWGGAYELNKTQLQQWIEAGDHQARIAGHAIGHVVINRHHVQSRGHGAVVLWAGSGHTKRS